jgi:hypothetical protein
MRSVGEVDRERDRPLVVERDTFGPRGVELVTEVSSGDRGGGIQPSGVGAEHGWGAAARGVGPKEDGRLAVATVARQRFDEGAHGQPQLGPRARAVPLAEQPGERRHRMSRLVHARCSRHESVARDAGEEPVVDLFCCGEGIGEMARRRRRIALGEAFAVQMLGAPTTVASASSASP